MDRVFCGIFRDAILNEHVQQVLIDCRLNHIRFFSLLETYLAILELTGATAEAAKIDCCFRVSLQCNFELLGHPVIEYNTLQRDS